MDVIEIKVKRDRPPYLLGLLCVLPLIGAFVGLALLLYGIIRYKDWKLILIGSAGILWTVVVYGSLFFFVSNKKGFVGDSMAMLSSSGLVTVVKAIEFYKLQYGHYPEKLEDLGKGNDMLMINDPLAKAGGTYQYTNFGDKYTVYSVGRDGIPHTEDDIYPNITIPDSSKIGLIRR